jgi:hypothetical protein
MTCEYANKFVMEKSQSYAEGGSRNINSAPLLKR